MTSRHGQTPRPRARIRPSRSCPGTLHIGEMAERFKAPVLKTGEGSNLPWVRIPLSPPDTQDAPKGAFCVSGGESWVQETGGFDGFAWSESGQPNGWPWSAQRGRVRCMDAPHNPTRSARRSGGAKGGVLRIWGESWVPETGGFDGFAWSESGQPNGWPWSAQRGRVRCMDAPHNLTFSANRS